MDFSKIKQTAQKMKDSALEKTKKVTTATVEISKKAKNSTLAFTDKKLLESRYVIRTKEGLDEIIALSKNSTFTEKKTGLSKTFIKKSIVIFCDISSDFGKNILYGLPILLTKTFSQNIVFRIYDISSEKLNKDDYKIDVFPSLVVFENEGVKTTLSGEENIQKVVKSLSLDINKTIDSL